MHPWTSELQTSVCREGCDSFLIHDQSPYKLSAFANTRFFISYDFFELF